MSGQLRPRPWPSAADDPTRAQNSSPLDRSNFAKLIADDTEKWGKVIRAANIKAE
jgi:hypothetical protein